MTAQLQTILEQVEDIVEILSDTLTATHLDPMHRSAMFALQIGRLHNAAQKLREEKAAIERKLEELTP